MWLLTWRLCVQVRKRKWENYSSGEELFGLQVTSYPELEQTEKEVSMLDRLYR
jgi:dynein heavy chain